MLAVFNLCTKREVPSVIHSKNIEIIPKTSQFWGLFYDAAIAVEIITHI